MKTFPTLYKKNSSGGIEEWSIIAMAIDNGHGLISTCYGEHGGKFIETTDTIKEGKNAGKKNETTPYAQAVKEAEAKWTKKLKSGYVQTLEVAHSGGTDKIIEGGILPMLAKSYSDDGGKIIFPCAGQPKLDGIRCIAVKRGTEVNLYSRTRKPIKSCPHIIEGILEVFNGSDGTFDGELYNHDLKNDFESIVSAVRKDYPSEAALKVQYHIYDIAQEGTPFYDRSFNIVNAITGDHGSIKLVETKIIYEESEVPTMFRYYSRQGYEGLMVRNLNSHYEYKRSSNLQKVKEFKDAEFEIIGVEEGRGKLQGLLGAFVLKTASGEEFKAKMTGNQEATRVFIEDPASCIGKMLTVQYQELTGKNGVPRFPVGLRLRLGGL